MIRFENASVTYPGGVHALRNVTLEIPDGQMLVIVGLSGAGKSTLIRAINGLVPLSAGDVTIDGQSVRRASPAQLRRMRSKIGMIFQTFNLLQGFTALENVMAPLMFSNFPAKEHRDRAMTLLETLEIERPNQRVEEMSIGQQQRVAIARAVACEPVLVLADEPTASLDPENAEAAMDLIQRTCLEHGASLEETVVALAAKGVASIRVVPVFLGQGGHVKEDLPQLVSQCARAGLELHLEKPIGERSEVIEAIEDHLPALWLGPGSASSRATPTRNTHDPFRSER
jgi:phosphonate transport system ATP-binding protein